MQAWLRFHLGLGSVLRHPLRVEYESARHGALQSLVLGDGQQGSGIDYTDHIQGWNPFAA